MPRIAARSAEEACGETSGKATARPRKAGCVLSKVSQLDPSLGWCDDPADTAYNRRVTLPYPASCERLWRDDRLYDLMAVTDYNMDPVASGAGSAIFVHVAGEGLPPTEGCVAFALDDLREILAGWRPGDRLIVG